MDISRRVFLKAAGAAMLASPLARAANTPTRPNIVFILADDLGWTDVGFMGSKYYETPNLDKIARQGIVFTNAYSNGPNCAPTRASLLSGQYTPRHGIYTVTNSDRGPSKQRKLIPTPTRTTLDSNIITIAEALKPAGYISASMGKWHMGNDPQLGPIGQGFDLNIGGNIAGHPKSYFSPYKNPNLKDGPKGEYLTDRLTDEALKFIEANKTRPFFLYLPHYAVHTPIQAKDQITQKYKAKTPSNGHTNPKYAAMIESMDTGIGRIMDKLDQLNLTDNTIVIFFSDNGGLKTVTSAEPLRGGKGMLYEGGIRVPLAVRWPGSIKPSTKCDQPVIGIDFYPTLLDIAKTPRPQNHTLDGVSIIGPLTGGRALSREAIYWHFPAYLQGKATGARDQYFRTRPGSVIRQGPWKLIEYFEDSDLELYNLADDIGEKNNLAHSHPDRAAQLHLSLKKWRKEIGAPVPTKPNPQYDPTSQ